MFESVHTLLAEASTASSGTELKTAVAAFIVGIAVGITGMGGGALMTPALIFLGVGSTSTVVTADLTAAAVSRSAGAAMHWRQGSPNLVLAGWLIAGSVPCAFLGPLVLPHVTSGADFESVLQECIGFALLFAATTYALRLYIELRRRAAGLHVAEGDPRVRPIPTVLVGALGGLLVGITSVGSGSIIMIALITLYPTLSALKLVGTDLVQAVPLVLAAAVSNVIEHGLDIGITIPLIIGSVPGTMLGAKVAARVRPTYIRRGIVVVLTMSGLALLDKSGWAPLGAGSDQTHPVAITLFGVALVFAVPVVWGFLRRGVGLPMFGSPTVADLETPEGDLAPDADAATGPPKVH
jgi:uncharacterized membrane protein YfcA